MKNDESTPVKEYKVNGHSILVKRDDLFMANCQLNGCPPLAKLRGASVLLQRLKNEGVKKIGVFDTRISKAGQGISFLCKELSMECLVGFPQLKGSELAESHLIAEQLGGKLYPLKAGRTAICYHTFKAEAERQGYHMLPLGLVCQETVEAVKNEALRYISTYMKSVAYGIDPLPRSIIVSVGTGTIATGVALGFAAVKAKVYGISCGMAIEKQWKRILQLAYPELISNLLLVPPNYDYYTALDTSSCPFPTSPYYDMKAWIWLCEHLSEIEHPVLFWNIGV